MAKKITLIICFTLIAIFAGLVIASVAIQHDFKSDISKPDSVEIVNKANRHFYTADEQINLDTIYEKFQSQTKVQYLSALLNGTLKSQKSEITQSAMLSYSGTGKFYLIFHYNQTQKLKLSNGTNYDYSKFLFEVDKTDSMKRLSIYVIDDAKSTAETYKYCYTISQYCDLTNLYNYFDSLNPNFISGSTL